MKQRRTNAGGIGFGVLMALGVIVLMIVGIGGCAVSKNNTMIAGQEDVDAKWTEIRNQYQRRYELIPQLVETVKGAAEFESSTLQEVTEARASVGKMQLPASAPTDPAQLEQFMQAQNTLGASLGRLLVVAEQYPQLKATQNFLSLQDQLEGTENRIAVARRDYIDSVKLYNTSIRTFPGNIVASFRGFEPYSQLEVDEKFEEVPKVDFGTSE